MTRRHGWARATLGVAAGCWLAATLAAAQHSPVPGSGPDAELIPDTLVRSIDGTAPERAAALRALGRVSDLADIRAYKIERYILRAALSGDEPPQVRKVAVEAAARLAVNADDTVRIRVLEALRKLLEAESSRVPLTVRWQVARNVWPILDPETIGPDKKMFDLMRRLAVSRNAPMLLRLEALRTLGLTSPKLALDIFRVTLLDRGNPEIQAAALEALGQRLTPKTFKRTMNDRLRLQYMLALDGENVAPRHRGAAMIGLARIGVTAGIPKILAVLETAKADTEEQQELIISALRALAIFRSLKTAEALSSAYHRHNLPAHARIREQACTALGELYRPLSKSRIPDAPLRLVSGTLVHVLRKDRSIPVVRAAAFWLGSIAVSDRFPRRKAVEALIEALTDPDPQVRALCAESLEDLTLQRVARRSDRSLKDYQTRWRKWYKQHKNRFPE